MPPILARVLAVLLLPILVGLTGCTVNPATGERILTFQSWDWERQVGAEAAPGLTEQFGGETPDAEAQAYVDEVGRRLLGGIEEGVPQLEWEFTLLDSPVINAFALPGGKVFLSRGLAEKLGSESEMAGVIGHEIGHVTARHGNQRISKAALAAGVVSGAAFVVDFVDDDTVIARYGKVGVPLIAVGGNFVMLSYGRDDELEADMLGIRYMTRAGYDPVGQRRVMETLRAAAGPSYQPEWLSTHPASETRIERIDRLLRGEYAFTQNNAEYITGEEVYERRMLARLRRLPPAPQPPTAEAMLPAASLWCTHCRLAEGG